MSESNQIVEELQRVVIKEELMALIETYYGNKQGIHMRAAYLNNLIFWQGIQLKSDLTAKNKIQRAIQSKISAAKIEKMKENLRNGWFYKSSEDHQIELMGFCSPSSITRMNKEFQEQEWAEIGKNPDPKKKWDKTTWYKLDLIRINSDLNKLGFHLEGFKFSEEKEEKTAPDSIFHGENSIFHGERSNFHGERSIFHDGRTIPEGITEGLSEGTSKEEEEEEIVSSILDNPSLKLLKELAVKVGYSEDVAMKMVNYVNDKGITNLNESIIMQSFSEVQRDINNGEPIINMAKWTAGKIKFVSERPNLNIPKSENGAPMVKQPNKGRKPVREEVVPPYLKKEAKEMDPSDEAYDYLKTKFKDENPYAAESELSVWMDQKYKLHGVADFDYTNLKAAMQKAEKDKFEAILAEYKGNKQSVSM